MGLLWPLSVLCPSSASCSLVSYAHPRHLHGSRYFELKGLRLHFLVMWPSGNLGSHWCDIRTQLHRVPSRQLILLKMIICYLSLPMLTHGLLQIFNFQSNTIYNFYLFTYLFCMDETVCTTFPSYETFPCILTLLWSWSDRNAEREKSYEVMSRLLLLMNFWYLLAPWWLFCMRYIGISEAPMRLSTIGSRD